jgi:hypothetical protein
LRIWRRSMLQMSFAFLRVTPTSGKIWEATAGFRSTDTRQTPQVHIDLVQLGVNKPSVISYTAQLLLVLGVDGLSEGSFMSPSTSSSSR